MSLDPDTPGALDDRYRRERHPGTVHVLNHLVPNPRLPAELRNIAELVAELADDVLTEVPDGPELTAGLRKLLEAKDCFVRARLDADRP